MSSENPQKPQNPYAAQNVEESGQVTGDATGGIIPYKNVAALIAYYMGVFSLLPCIGLPLAPIAIILAIIGFFKYKAEPKVAGLAHVVVAIVLSLVSIGYHVGGWFLMVLR